HNASDRKHRKFIRVNCASISESLLEKELFGCDEGAFSGTNRGGKVGLFEEANHGTIFLDEIGDLSLTMQAKLLRVLQKKEITRLRGLKVIPFTIVIITATNRNLEKAITHNDFREDLYYRLNRLPIHIPPLRDRLEDLEALVKHMIEKVNQLYGRNVQSIATSALQKLKQYHWSGNIRELEYVISRAVIFMDISEKEITFKHLSSLDITFEEEKSLTLQENMTLQTATEQFESEYIQTVYKNNG